MALVLKTWGEMLQDVRTAMTAITSGGQRYELNGRMLQRGDLEWLHKQEIYYTNKLQREGDVIVGQAITRGSAQVSFS